MRRSPGTIVSPGPGLGPRVTLLTSFEQEWISLQQEVALKFHDMGVSARFSFVPVTNSRVVRSAQRHVW